MGADQIPTADEKRYTLAEARREMAAQLCMTLGHDVRIAYREGRWRIPESLGCLRCFEEWDVVPCRHQVSAANSGTTFEATSPPPVITDG